MVVNETAKTVHTGILSAGNGFLVSMFPVWKAIALPIKRLLVFLAVQYKHKQPKFVFLVATSYETNIVQGNCVLNA